MITDDVFSRIPEVTFAAYRVARTERKIDRDITIINICKYLVLEVTHDPSMVRMTRGCYMPPRAYKYISGKYLKEWFLPTVDRENSYFDTATISILGGAENYVGQGRNNL